VVKEEPKMPELDWLDRLASWFFGIRILVFLPLLVLVACGERPCTDEQATEAADIYRTCIIGGTYGYRCGDLAKEATCHGPQKK
jgi:hypothetical protein